MWNMCVCVCVFSTAVDVKHSRWSAKCAASTTSDNPKQIEARLQDADRTTKRALTDPNEPQSQTTGENLTIFVRYDNGPDADE